VEWDWKFAWNILPELVTGLTVTIQATIVGTILAAVSGFFIAIARRSRNKLLSRPVEIIALFVRGTPLLLQLYFLFYVLPDIGILLSPLVAGFIGIGVHYSTYLAEVYRAGIENIPRGQWEAARACNLNGRQTWTHIIIPQAIPPMIPALGNYVVMMLKETPYLSAITVYELMNAARGVANSHYRYFEPMTMVGVLFLVMTIPAVMLLKRLEKRYSGVN
jgi:polar amino acid transport system permease protein